jgi:hypothetical protein
MPQVGLVGLQVFEAVQGRDPVRVDPPARRTRKWSRQRIAEWLVDQLSGSEKVVVGIDHAFLFPASYLNRYGLADWDTIATCLNMKRPLREQVTERLARLDIRVVGLHEQLDRIEQLLRARGSALEWSIAQESGYEEGCVRGDNRVQAE